MNPLSHAPRLPVPRQPLIVLATTLLITGGMTFYAARNITQKDHLRFETSASQFADGLRERIDASIAVLRAGVGLITANPNVDASGFGAFVNVVGIPDNYSGMQALGYAQRVAGKPDLEKIVYFAPADESNRGVLGLNMLSEPALQEAMQRAHDMGLPSASGATTFLQSAPSDKDPGFFLFVPVYTGGITPSTLEARRASLKGFMFSPFLSKDFFDGIYRSLGQPVAHVEVFDGTVEDASKRLFSNRDPKRWKSLFSTARRLDLAGRTFVVRSYSLPLADPVRHYAGVAGILLTGLIISFLLYASMRSEARTRLTAEQSTRMLSQSEDALREARDKLELRVEERTRELRDSTAALQTQMEERLRVEEELSRSRKLEAVGRLAGGVAHDFNNIMTGIGGLCEDLLLDTTLSAARRTDIEEIAQAAARASDLTRQLLAFGRRQVLMPAILDLNTLITTPQKLWRRLLGENINLVLDLDPSTGRILADAGQIDQVLINLLVNAKDAMPNGGRVTIETRNVDMDEAHVQGRMGLKPGEYVRLQVSDTGLGMDTEIQEHVFEPFFTTKSKDKGTGLGLATVYGIVKQNNGHIFLTSSKGEGTAFEILLPRAATLPTLEKPVPQESTVPQGSGTILIVEDENIVRRIVKKALTKQGYEVIEARNGEEALIGSLRYEGKIDLLLTDVVMPGMNGRALAEKMRASRPDIGILYMSGYPENIVVDRGILTPGIVYIQKPFAMQTLIRKVASVLIPASTDSPT